MCLPLPHSRHLWWGGTNTEKHLQVSIVTQSAMVHSRPSRSLSWFF